MTIDPISATMAEIGKIDPEITSIEQLEGMSTIEAFNDYVMRGYSMLDSFKLANFDALLERSANGARQSALNSVSERAHLAPTDGTEANTDGVPADILEQYRSFFPTWTDAQITEDYQKRR
ncbi:MAG: hypothetical protein RR829_05185 [Oscillospiraceae bacterium]